MKLALKAPKLSLLTRIHLWHWFLVIVTIAFVIKLFYLQVIRHDYYQKAALSNQLKQYEIPAKRGTIMAHSGGEVFPLVLNETRYTVFADPKFIKEPIESAMKIQKILGGDASKYEQLMSKGGSRYEILAKQVPKGQYEKIIRLKLKGVGTQPVNYRTYPQGELAAQLLGFVNDGGEGTYGIEQALEEKLKGSPGQLKAITDINGVPLAANEDNYIVNPVDGKNVLLTIDVGMQSQLEELLKQGLKDSNSVSGSALIIEAKTGAVKAIANLPSYNPSEYYKVSDASVFTNAAVSSPLEIGSVMKPFTAAAALDKGVVKPDTSYYDPSFYVVDDFKITNIEEDGGPGTRSVADILQLSLNTGATWLLMQLGGGQLNQQARVTWRDYMVNHYQYSKKTGIEQGYEADGSVPDPVLGYGLDLQYANTSFGQGMTATPLQVGAALASIVNGGTFYQPRLVDGYIDAKGQVEKVEPKVVRRGVIKPEVSDQIVALMQNIANKNYQVYLWNKPRANYIIGGKTGTAQIPSPDGGYYSNKYNGMFMGFVGGDEAQYVVVVRANEPRVVGYAGSKAAAPIFGKIADVLIDNFGVQPKSQ